MAWLKDMVCAKSELCSCHCLVSHKALWGGDQWVRMFSKRALKINKGQGRRTGEGSKQEWAEGAVEWCYSLSAGLSRYRKGVFLFLKILFIYSRETIRGRDTGRGRSRFPVRSLMWHLIPGPWDHDLSQRQILNHWGHPGAPVESFEARMNLQKCSKLGQED